MNLLQVEFEVLDHCPEPMQVFKTEFLPSRHRFFLESSVIKAGFSRFSFMGDTEGRWGEVVTYDTGLRQATVTRGAHRETHPTDSFFDLLKARLRDKSVDCPAELPFSFNLGYVGVLGYELKGETIGAATYRSETCDAAFLLATRMVVFDHLEQRCYLLHLVSDAADRQQAGAWFAGVKSRLGRVERTGVTRFDKALVRQKLSLPEVERWIASQATIRHAKRAYIDKIHQALRYITDGESYEICLTNLIEFPFSESPFDLYCAMRQISPAPHAAYLTIGEFHLAGSSPERFLSVDRHGLVEARPIKGTRARGLTAKEDVQQIEDLRHDEKDRAENLMIVDLLRNDLGQVCALRSVHVPQLFKVESYSHVHQLVSTICGQLKPEVTAIDCVRAAFPGGSMTGAPKKRTMEIIDRLENGPRGAYSGALGWFGLCGACDFNIVIRSVTIEAGLARFGVGGAITALSDPESEFAETMMKARGVVEAVEHLRRMAPTHAEVTMGAADDFEPLVSEGCK